MNTRCKPGDLAQIVKAAQPENLGRVITVVEPWPYTQEPAWVTFGGTGVWSYDKNLRPFRPQPDDAQDETLQWLPTPSRETESA